MPDLISVIIPVYNAAPYISTCIQSVLHQTYSCFELLLVDDGSQDESKDICEKISLTDNRIRFFPQEHRGVSVARNKALNAAKGSYVFFLDSDDVIHPCLLETLHTVLNRTQASMAATEYCFRKAGAMQQFERNEIAPPHLHTHNFSDYIYLTNDIVLDLFAQRHTHLLYGLGGIIVSRTQIASLLFDERLTHGEDTKFVYQALLLGADVAILHKQWYYYRIHEKNSRTIRTKNSCHSMYKCECYMRDNEIKCNRITNALKLEQGLLTRICEWYIMGRRNHDIALCSYLRKIATRESHSDIFRQLCLNDRINFSLIFHCPPSYWILNAFRSLNIYFTVLYNFFIDKHSFAKILENQYFNPKKTLCGYLSPFQCILHIFWKH